MMAKTRKSRRHTGIIGIGQTEYTSHKEYQNQAEMVNEAVRLALYDAGITIDDVDCVVHGNMELFEMIFQPDLWHSIGTGAYGKEQFRITTGGTTGASLVCAADHLIGSGMYDIVMAIGMEKLQEGNTTGGITNMACPLWARNIQTGALTGTAAQDMIEEFGYDRAQRDSMRYRIMMDKNACLNPRAHRRLGLEYDQMDNLIKTSPRLVGDLRLIHMCSQSDGACVMIFASEEKAKTLSDKPVWIRDHISVHREESFNVYGFKKPEMTHHYAARKLFERNGIKDPVEYFDVFEMYDPSSWWGLNWLREFMLLKGDEHLSMLENGEFAIDGRLPVNPSGGVTATNPIGATAMLRPAEAALQIRGDAGEHQIKKDVRHALASGFGGTMWTVLIMLEKELGWDGMKQVESRPSKRKKLEPPHVVVPVEGEELISMFKVNSIGQRFPTGPVMGRWFEGLKEKKFYASICPECGRTQIPPREICANCRVRCSEIVEVGPEGTVTNSSTVFYASPNPLTGEVRKTPYVNLVVMLDGATEQECFSHMLNNEDIKRIRPGMKVRPVWADERTGSFSDLLYFEIADRDGESE
jgi:acetyl-CoA C-acetyltransferase